MTTLPSLLLLAAFSTLLATFAAGVAIALGRIVRTPIPATPGGTLTTEGRSTLRPLRYGLALAFVLLVGASGIRAVAVGHAPWSNLHEFSVAFAAGLVGVHLAFGRDGSLDGLAPLTAALGAGLLGLALQLDDRIEPLVPALQQPLLLTVHVGAAALAYAVAGVAFVAAVAEISQRASGGRLPMLPGVDVARRIGHRAVLVAFPILTIAIALGSVWANLAWRSYWSNDPKELAAAATWLVFGAYLHVAGRRDRWQRSAPWLIVLGFVGVLFTYIGAGLFFVGEHSYAAP